MGYIDLKKNRVEWVDLYKAIAIILVVMGHTTGLVNPYIYFFHVPAFFLISGYTSGIEKKSWGEIVFSRAYQLLLPLGFILAGFAGFAMLLHSFGWYNRFFDGEYPGFLNTICRFLTTGDIMVPWLGASWFLLCLYGVQIVAKALVKLGRNGHRWGVVIGSAVLLIIAYGLTDSSKNLTFFVFNINLILLFQFYYVLGWILRQANMLERLHNANYKVQIGVFFGTLFSLFVLQKAGGRATDYVSLKWNPIVSSVFGALLGCLMLAAMSMLLEHVSQVIKKPLLYCGRNTLSILLFHFVAYKIPFAILLMFGMIPSQQMAHLTPYPEVGSLFWPLLVPAVIIISLLLWKVLTFLRIGKILMGVDRAVISKITDICQTVKDSAKNIFKQLKSVFGGEALHSKVGWFVVGASLYAIWPMLQQGITVNDELQIRFDRQQGLINCIVQNIQTSIAKGRILSIPFDWRFMGFLTRDMFWNKVICVGLILLNVILMVLILYRLKKDAFFSVFTAFIIIVCMPITFEHTPPSAFTPLLALPMMWLELSLLCFLNVVEKRESAKKQMILSGIFFFIAMTGYEFLIMYSLLYPLIYWYVRVRDHEKWSFLKALQVCLPQVLSVIVYLVLYLGSRKLFPSGYDGNQVAFVSLHSSIQIIKTLFLSALPGYYYWNAKYRYLAEILNGGIFAAGWWKNLGLLLFIFAIVVIAYYVKAKSAIKSSWAAKVIGFLTLILYMVLPSIPNSLSSMYQGNVSDTFFTSLPVSYFLYFAAATLFATIVWEIKENITFRVKPAVSTIFIAAILLVVIVPQQSLNHIIAKEQAANYQRLLAIEDLFETGSIREVQGEKVYAPDLYETKNLLAINPGYWEKYAAREGLQISFVTDIEYKKETAASIDIQDGMILLWLYKDQVLRVMTTSIVSSEVLLVSPDGQAHQVKLGAPLRDGNFYFYGLYWNPAEHSLTQFT